MKTKQLALAAGMFLAAAVNGFGQNLTDPVPEPSPVSMTGTPGVATKRAVVNFSELARSEALARASSAVGTAAQPSGITIGKPSGAPGSGGPSSDGPPPGPPPPPDLCPVTNAPSPAASFLALLGEGELIDKPDTQGAVGPDHLMVALNTSVRIQDRSGGVISTVSLSNFWASLGPFNVFYFNGIPFGGVFDPKLLYDPSANRFIFVTLANAVAAHEK